MSTNQGEWQRSADGKVTVGLTYCVMAVHQPCITDYVVNPPTGSMAYEMNMSTPTMVCYAILNLLGRTATCYRTVVCLSCLSETLVYCGQTVGGRLWPRPQCVRWGPSSPTESGRAAPHFSALVYCGQTVAHVSNCCSSCFTIL